MLIIETNDKLLTWFSKNESFCFKDNYKDLMAGHISLTKDADRAAVEIGLRNLEQSGLIKSFQLNNEFYWILDKPINMYDKNVNLSYSTCLILSEISQQYANQFNNKDLLIDPTQIGEKEILKILGILVQTVKSKFTEEQSDKTVNPEDN